MTWAPDAQLTPLGHSQAATARRAWQTEIRNGIMIPQIFYVSPMRRALETWTDTFGITGNDAILSNEHRKVTILEVSYAILHQSDATYFLSSHCIRELPRDIWNLSLWQAPASLTVEAIIPSPYLSIWVRVYRRGPSMGDRCTWDRWPRSTTCEERSRLHFSTTGNMWDPQSKDHLHFSNNDAPKMFLLQLTVGSYVVCSQRRIINHTGSRQAVIWSSLRKSYLY